MNIGKGIGTFAVWATVAVIGVYGDALPEVVLTIALLAVLATMVIWH